MTEIVVKQMPAFKRAYKKLHNHTKLAVNEAIHEIIKKPDIGEGKVGDLAGVYVYKFRVHHQELLLAYEYDIRTRLLLALGVHENFYRDIKSR